MMMGAVALHTADLREGTGLPLVLLHGFPVDLRMWTVCAQHLPPGIRAIGVDLPGAGHSDLARGVAPRLEHAAQRVHDTLSGLGVGNAIIVGLSMGGYVALAVADLYPSLVAGLGLVDTKSVADDDAARVQRHKVASWLEETQTINPVLAMPSVLLSRTSATERRHLFPTVEAWIRSQSPAGLAWMQRAMAARGDRTAVLENFHAPVEIVVGAEDTLSPPAQAEHMAAAVRAGGGDVIMTEIGQVGHLAPIEAPGGVAQALGRLHQRVRDR